MKRSSRVGYAFLLAFFAMVLALPSVTKAQSRQPRIVFSSNRTGNNDIFIMNEDGSGVVNLTNDPGDDSLPQWFNDGSRIVFRSNRSGEFEIYTMKTDGTDIVNISDNPSADDTPISISPNGLRLSAVENSDGGDPLGNKNYTINLLDGEEKAMLVPSDSIYATSDYAQSVAALWEPGSQSLLTNIIGVDGSGNLDATNPATFQVFRAQQDGSSVAPLISAGPGLVKAFATASPDGSKIAYTSYGVSSVGSSIYISNLSDNWTTSNPITEVASSSSVEALRNAAFWSADSSKLLFSSNSDGNWDIYTVSPDGSNRVKLTDFGNFRTEAYWYGTGWVSGTSSNKILLNTDKDGNAEIYFINSDGTGLTNLTNNAATDVAGFGGVEPTPPPEEQPQPPHTGKLVGATIASISVICMVLVVAKEIKERHHHWGRKG